ncbi:MAG: hypothetical protein LBQ35_09525 [Spirochaetaceae bacterium]|jgi:hypothetical protein|nr:hypothetical protein [Spirochaetaceae bacterium]
MKRYFEAVTLGAFTLRDRTRTARFMGLIRDMPFPAGALQFLFIAAALNFPVMLALARLSPYELFNRLYGGNIPASLPEEAAVLFSGGAGEGLIGDFNLFMLQNGYGRRILLPLLGMAFALVVLLQAVFFLSAGFCLGLKRMVSVQIPFGERAAFLLFLSTLPAGLCLLLGLVLPTVHLIVFFLSVIMLGFYRNGVAVAAVLEAGGADPPAEPRSLLRGGG